MLQHVLGAEALISFVLDHLLQKMLASWKEIYDKSRQHIKKQRYQFIDKDPCSQSYVLFQCVCVLVAQSCLTL